MHLVIISNCLEKNQRDQLLFQHKDKAIYIEHNIIFWSYNKQWLIIHTSDLMMITRKSTHILTIITRQVEYAQPQILRKGNWREIICVCMWIVLDKKTGNVPRRNPFISQTGKDVARHATWTVFYYLVTNGIIVWRTMQYTRFIKYEFWSHMQRCEKKISFLNNS